MVKNSGKTPGSGPIRALNLPAPITVEEDSEGSLVALVISRRRLKIVEVEDSWEIDEDWWRPHPVARVYYRLALEGNRSLTIFRDRATGSWYRQRYD